MHRPQLRFAIVFPWVFAMTLGACSSQEPSQSVPDCRPKAEVSAHQGYLEELVTHYCPVLLNTLAPAPPKDVAPLVTFDNPTPALPNYLSYPDVDPMMGNTRRLSLIAGCMYKRCLTLAQEPTLLCQGATSSSCKDTKATFMLDALVHATKVCKPSPYTLRRMAKSMGTLYQEREKKPLTTCQSETTKMHPDLSGLLGNTTDTCSPERADCLGDLTCVRRSRGHRCLNRDSPADAPLCGDSILEAGEACECDLAYQTLFFQKRTLPKPFMDLGTCPGRFSITNGTEKALGFQCDQCRLIHPRHPREWRQNAYYLPEKDLTKPLGQPTQKK